MEELPVLSSNPNDSRSIVVSVLSKKWPLSAKQVYRESRKLNHQLTYQAIHKTIKQLEAAKILSRRPTGYVIDAHWVRSLFSFTDELRKKNLHGNANSFLEISPNSTETFEFDARVVEPYYWLLNEIFRVVNAKKKKGNLILHADGAWPITVLTDKEYDQFKTILKYLKFYQLSRTKTLVDSVILSFSERAFGMQWKAPVPCAEKGELIIFYDYVVQKKESKELKAAWKKTYSFVKSPLAALSTIYDFVFGAKKYKVTFVVTRNSEFATALTTNTLDLFKKRR